MADDRLVFKPIGDGGEPRAVGAYVNMDQVTTVRFTKNEKGVGIQYTDSNGRDHVSTKVFQSAEAARDYVMSPQEGDVMPSEEREDF